MNEYDSNRIFDTVKKIGLSKTSNQADADCYLINTCHIRDKAKEKIYHEVGRVKKIFRNKKKPFGYTNNPKLFNKTTDSSSERTKKKKSSFKGKKKFKNRKRPKNFSFKRYKRNSR